MNERIRDLQIQAFADCKAFEGDKIRTDEVFERFAELIVRECVKEIEFQYGGGSDQPMDNEWDRAIECVSSMVKYRFGVENA